jgi:outer membrane protein assembly factor BamB
MTNDRDGVPERLGDYTPQRRLGSGGMGVVYLARTVTGRQLAIKVIRREYAEDPGFRARFRREVAAARRVSGAFTAPVVDADPEGDPPWLATLYVPGGSLADRLDREGPLEPGDAARVGAQLAEALQDIHRCGLVHRDLKPGNVLLAEDGVRVIDFGISRAMSDSHRLTEAGAVLGSPPFMAPEQLTGGGEVGTAADVFALGAVVAFAATGHSPFEERRGRPGSDPLAVAYRVVHEDPDLSDVPEPLRELVSLCLAKDPERRPALPTLLRMASWADTRARGTVVPASPEWQGRHRDEDAEDVRGIEYDEDAGDGEDEVPAGPTAPGRRPPRRRRFAVGAAALAMAGATGFGVWLAQPSDPARPSAAHGTEDPAGGETPPWELDLRDFGVLDAATGAFACQPTAGDLLCGEGGTFAVLLGPDGGVRLRHDGPRDAVGGPAPLATGEAVYVRSDRGVDVLDRTGGERWRIDAPELAGTLLRVGDTLVLQNGDSTLRFYAMDAPDPLGEWSAPGRYITRTVGNSSYTLVETRAEETGGEPQLMLLDPNGREMWTTPREAPAAALGYTEIAGMDEEALYALEFDSELPVVTAVLRLDLMSGEWRRTELPQPAEPRSAIADGVVYVLDSAGLLTAVDAAAGEVLWSERTGAALPSAPAVADGTVYLSDSTGRLYEVAARDGAVLRVGEAHPGTPGAGSGAWAPAPVIANGVAYVVTLGNTLYATPLAGGG